MHANESPEVKHYRTVAAVVRGAVLVGLVAGLAAIGSQAPERTLMSLNCAYSPSSAGTLTDASLELSAACGGAVEEAGPAAVPVRHGVPDAKGSLDARLQPEPQPATF